ncbi:MAG: hypothetical protein ABJF23_20560 [Bryobacteraceae bacterium]
MTLDPDVARDLKKRVKTDKVTLKEAVNSALRAGLRQSAPKDDVPFKVIPFENFQLHPGIDADKIGQFLDDLEVEDYLRKQGR